MGKDNYKSKNQQTPIENQDSAAWANREKRKRISKVNVPDESQIENAKDYVDDNQK